MVIINITVVAITYRSPAPLPFVRGCHQLPIGIASLSSAEKKKEKRKKKKKRKKEKKRMRGRTRSEERGRRRRRRGEKKNWIKKTTMMRLQARAMVSSIDVTRNDMTSECFTCYVRLHYLDRNQ